MGCSHICSVLAFEVGVLWQVALQEGLEHRLQDSRGGWRGGGGGQGAASDGDALHELQARQAVKAGSTAQRSAPQRTPSLPRVPPWRRSCMSLMFCSTRESSGMPDLMQAASREPAEAPPSLTSSAGG